MKFRIAKEYIEKINSSWKDASGHFSSIQWKGEGIDGRVSPRTGGGDRESWPIARGMRRGGVLVGCVTVVVPVR